MRVEPLQRWHVEALEQQGVFIGEILTKPEFFDWLAVNPSFAGVVDEGVVAIMGMTFQYKGNYRCWAHTDPVLAKKWFFALNKAMKAFLIEFKKPRIETVVYVGNEAGHRWCTEIHGFQQEGIMRNFHDGRDAALYSRIS